MIRIGVDFGGTKIEVAALDQKLKGMGQNSAVEFNERLLKAIANRDK